MTKTAGKKKRQRITLAVSKKNYNRLQFGTHSIEKVLKLEGHDVRNGHVFVDGQEIHLSAVDLYAKKKRQPPPLQVVEDNA
jgi:hypothetical protein